MTTRHKQIALLLALGIAATACNGDPSGPEKAKPGIQFTAGANLTDTVQAVPVQALNVLVVGPDGKPAAGTPVLFESVTVGAGPYSQRPTMWVGSVTSSAFTTSIGDTTDAKGQVSVRVRFGTRAGQGKVVVTAATLGYQDTARYTVQPGAAVRVVLAPRDTALYSGKSYSLRGGAQDRFGNTRADAVTYRAGSGPVTLNGGQATATGLGRALVFGQVGTAVDSVYVSVVPEGTVAVYNLRPRADSVGIVLINLDGSGFRRLAPRTASYADHMAPYWAPSGKELAYSDGSRIDSDSRLYRVDLNGTVQRLVSPAGTAAESWPQYTRDGAWIYYTRWPEVWRVKPDGTGAERVSPATASYGVDGTPSPSPDGTRVAYGTTRAGGVKIRVLTLATGTVQTFEFSGNAPRWSPDGKWIAFRDENSYSINIVRPDGTGLRMLTPAGRRYRHGHDWSPDGRWIVAAEEGARLNVINVESGEVLVLPFSVGMSQPTWKP